MKNLYLTCNYDNIASFKTIEKLGAKPVITTPDKHDEAVALKKANEGYSTKNLPNPEDRGYGISSTTNNTRNHTDT